MTIFFESLKSNLILSSTSKYNTLNIRESGISMWFERWFLSSNAKDIGVLYLIYALFSGLVGTAFSVLIRLELSGPGVQFIADNQLYNSIITAHAIIMIFFMVMPALIGGFGNFLLPLGLGGPDMGFPRLNNISYLSLIPSIVLFLFAGGIENGVGTGWTLNMESFLLVGSFFEFVYFVFFYKKIQNKQTVGHKFLSLRKYSQYKKEIRYSWLLLKSYVKMLITRGQYAWVAKRNFVIHQRLNKEYLVNNKKEWFEQWLVGITDGEGTFGFYKQNDNWILTYKIALSIYNIRTLYHIKTNLGIGNINKNDNKAQIAIVGRKKLGDTIFPIFDKYTLLTSKYLNYVKLKEAFNILESPNQDKVKIDKELSNLRLNTVSENYEFLAWNYYSLNHYKLLTIISKPWLSGFVEGKGSFYLVSKDKNMNSIVHGFGIRQKQNKTILEKIVKVLHISAVINYIKEYNYYTFNSTNSRAVENGIKFFNNILVGIRSLEFKIWAVSYKYKGEYDKLDSIGKTLLKINKKLRLIHFMPGNSVGISLGIEKTSDNYTLLQCKWVENTKVQKDWMNYNPLLRNRAFNKVTLLDCSTKKHYYTKTNSFSFNSFSFNYYNLSYWFYYLVNKLANYKKEFCSFNYYLLFYWFNYLFNKLSNYKKICYSMLFIYSIVILFIPSGFSTEYILNYYVYLCYLCIINVIINYLSHNKNILYNYPMTKMFLIYVLYFIEILLLGILIDIIAGTVNLWLKNVLGHLLKMNNPENNNPNNGPNNNGPKNNPNNGPNNNGPNNNPNNNGPNNNNTNDYNDNNTNDYNDSGDEGREEAYSHTTIRENGEGVETSYDDFNRKIARVTWKEIYINGTPRKQIIKTEYYNKYGVLYKAEVLENNRVVGTYKFKHRDVYK